MRGPTPPPFHRSLLGIKHRITASILSLCGPSREFWVTKTENLSLEDEDDDDADADEEEDVDDADDGDNDADDVDADDVDDDGQSKDDMLASTTSMFGKKHLSNPSDMASCESQSWVTMLSHLMSIYFCFSQILLQEPKTIKWKGALFVGEEPPLLSKKDCLGWLDNVKDLKDNQAGIYIIIYDSGRWKVGMSHHCLDRVQRQGKIFA